MGSNQSSNNQSDQNNNQQQQQQQQQQIQQFPSMNKKQKVNNKVSMQQLLGQTQEAVDLPQNNNQIFNDDEPIEVKEQVKQDDNKTEEEQKEQVKSNDKKKIDFDLQKDLIFSVKSMTKAIKLSQNEAQYIPAMVSIETNKDGQKLDLTQRPSLDLVCVIDRSGSMSGNKIDQVKEALNCLIELLNENDRIMLVQFDHLAQRILPFTRVSKQNIPKIKTAINSLRAAGGTKIRAGMELALKGIKERKYHNHVTSVFLLSDGQDSYDSIEYLKQEALNTQFVYSINSFGFGNDHDPNLMNQICQVQDGNFYYVEQIDTVDEMFIDALGGLFSVIAQGVNIRVRLQKDHKIFSDVSISKTYGDMWKFDNKTNNYNINILQLIAGVSKEFLLEIQLPPIGEKLQDFERNAQLITASIEMYANSDEQKKNPIIKEASLEMTFYNYDENIPGEAVQLNDDVELNYLRVRGADIIKQCMEKAEQGKYEEGQQLIKKIQKDIDNARPQNRQKLQMLYNDLQESEQTCNKERYQAEGKFKMISQNKAHMEKKSRNTKAKCESSNLSSMPQFDVYQNCLQQEMVQQRIMTKKSKQ